MTSPAPQPTAVASLPPEERGLGRDEVRLLVSSDGEHHHARFLDLPELLEADDVLVVNRSATLPASLPAFRGATPFRLNLCTRFGERLWLAEPRWSAARPGPVPLETGQRIEVGGGAALVGPSYPGIPRLRFIEFLDSWEAALERHGSPIRYGYLDHDVDLASYQTVFADRPGSAEMPSAGRPFTHRTVSELESRGVELVGVTLHTGVSSLEASDIAAGGLYPERFEVEPRTARRLNEALAQGRRIIAVGTTTVRALTSAWDGRLFHGSRGLTRAYVRPGRRLPPLSGLLTGFHEPEATHLDMLEAVAGRELLQEGYREARQGGYLWHEFGDVHLLLPGGAPAAPGISGGQRWWVPASAGAAAGNG